MDDLNLLKPICLFEQMFDSKLRLNDASADTFAEFSFVKDIVSTSSGSSMVTVGSTRVICGIKIKVVPNTDVESPFVCNVEQLGLSYRTARINSPISREAQTVSVQLQWLLDFVAAPDAKQQLIIPSTLPDDTRAYGMYIIHVDVLVIHDDGCLLDACLCAALVALSSAEWPRLMPTTETTVDKVQFSEAPSDQPSMKVTISNWLFAFTFAVVPTPLVGNSLLSQPSRRELLLWGTDASLCSVVVDSKGELVDFSLVGGFASGLSAHLDAVGVCGGEGDRGGVIAEIISRASNQAQLLSKEMCK